MNTYVEKLTEHLKLFPKDGDDFNTVLDVLYFYFTLEHSIESGTIRANFKEAGNILEKMSFEDNNKLFSSIVQLCEEHAKLGFMEGVRVGAVLMDDLRHTP